MDYLRRIETVRKKLDEERVDGLFVTRDTNVSYLSGFSLGDSMLLITKRKNIFITDFRYQEHAEASVTGFEVCIVSETTYRTVANICRSLKIKRVGFESMHIEFGALMHLKKAASSARFVPTKDVIETIRSAKDPDEVRAIRRSVLLTKKALERTVRTLKPGISERTYRNDIEVFFIRHNANAAFDPIVAFDRNSSKPHAVPGDTVMKKSGIALIDIGAMLDGYASDLTRTVLFGKIPPNIINIFNIVTEAQTRALAMIRPGATLSEVDLAARDYIHACGYGKQFGHSVGHGVGLDIHEQPNVTRYNHGKIARGMVFTVEPAVYIPGVGGVRIEDMVLVTKDGHEVITR